MIGQARRRHKAGLMARAVLAVLVIAPGLGWADPAVKPVPGGFAGQSQAGDDIAPSLTPMPPPSLTFYGSPGLVDMPSAEMLPDGQFVTSLSYFGGQTRVNLTFQATPWMSASFRYIAIQDWNMGGFETYYDRGFDVRFRLLEERAARPALTLGLQDFAGTGIYAGEYLVATKQFETRGFGEGSGRLPGRLKLSAGIGWGRFGSYNSLGTTGTRPAFSSGDTGGELSYDQWFRGPYALFGGIEWLPNEKLGLKLEYSSDDYVTETQVGSVFEKKSPFNFGIEYQVSPRTRLGAYYLYGSEFGLHAQIQLNPKHPPNPMRIAAPGPVKPRPDRATNPAAWGTGWAQSRTVAAAGTGDAMAAHTPAPRGVSENLAAALEPELAKSGLKLETLTVSAHAAELRYRNLRYGSFANATGRAARAMAAVLPASVETFRLVPVQSGMALSAVTLRRSDLEALEFDPLAADALLAVAGIGDAPALPEGAVMPADLYPAFSWALKPYVTPSYFDPDQPLRIDAGLALRGSWQPGPGWIVSGAVRHRLFGNIKDGRPSDSTLPHVRTDAVLYAQEDTTLNNLFVAKQWRPGRDLYARATGGLLEAMYGGVSTELLWKPVGSPLGLGVEANYVIQRDYDQRFDFLDYKVFTGHASAYYDFGEFEGQLDVGRYLAGDYGATFTLDRVFDNGWRVGAFFTLTNVSAEEFGEGSFDKGIRFSMPLRWFLGTPSRQSIGTTVRPIQRDGGQKVHVPGRLYRQVRDAHAQALVSQWGRVWE